MQGPRCHRRWWRSRCPCAAAPSCPWWWWWGCSCSRSAARQCPFRSWWSRAGGRWRSGFLCLGSRFSGISGSRQIKVPKRYLQRWMGGYEVPPPPPPGTPHNAILYSACLRKANFLSLSHHHIHSSLLTSCLACSEKGHLQLFRLEVFKSFSTSTQKWTHLP